MANYLKEGDASFMKKSGMVAVAFLIIVATVFTFSFSAFGKEGDYDTPIIFVSKTTTTTTKQDSGQTNPTANPPADSTTTTTQPQDPGTSTDDDGQGEESTSIFTMILNAIKAFFRFIVSLFSGFAG